MILRLTGGDEARFPQHFAAMYRWRHRVFVERRRWYGLACAQGLERDAYDTPETIYFMEVGENGAIRASARLLPTEGAHVLADVFPSLVAGAVPRGRHIREISRFYVTGRGEPSRRRDRIRRLSHTIMSDAREHGVTMLTAVVGACMLPVMARHGWSVAPLGPTWSDCDGTSVAITVDICATLARISPRPHAPAKVAPLPCHP